MENILQDYHVLDFYVASAATDQFTVHLFPMQHLRCVLNYNDNMNWHISFGQGILRESGKTERVGEKSGNFKILLTRQIIYTLF